MKVASKVARSSEGITWKIVQEEKNTLLIFVSRTESYRLIKKSDYMQKKSYPVEIPVFKLGSVFE